MHLKEGKQFKLTRTLELQGRTITVAAVTEADYRLSGFDIISHITTFGISILNPNDNNIPDLGKTIAVGKALKYKTQLEDWRFITSSFNKNLVEGALIALMKDIEENGSKYCVHLN